MATNNIQLFVCVDGSKPLCVQEEESGFRGSY